MKDVIDVIVLTLFVLFMVALISGFNRRMMDKHKEKQENKK